MLDEAGFEDCGIVASNSLDEYIIRDILGQGGQVDSFGVGERLVTAKSDPVFGGVYKLAAVEKENPKMPETVDAVHLKEMQQSGELTNCIVEGPIAYDLCMDKDASAIKGYDSPVAGDADILVVPDIVAGNLVSKCLTCTGGSHTCGTVWGAKVPIILTSRSAATEDKYMSIILSAAAGGV